MGCRRPNCETKLAVGPPTFLVAPAILSPVVAPTILSSAYPMSGTSVTQDSLYFPKGAILSAVSNTGRISTGTALTRPSVALISGRSTPSISSILLAPA
jgi:hypothetical protein